MKIRLSDADRALYGGPEWLDWDPDRLTVGEAEALQEHLGVTWQGYDAWLVKNGVAQIKWVLWVGLRRAGAATDWAAFDPEILRTVVERPEAEPEVAPKGKAPRRSTRPRPSASNAKT